MSSSSTAERFFLTPDKENRTTEVDGLIFTNPFDFLSKTSIISYVIKRYSIMQDCGPCQA